MFFIIFFGMPRNFFESFFKSKKSTRVLRSFETANQNFAIVLWVWCAMYNSQAFISEIADRGVDRAEAIMPTMQMRGKED